VPIGDVVGAVEHAGPDLPDGIQVPFEELADGLLAVFAVLLRPLPVDLPLLLEQPAGHEHTLPDLLQLRAVLGNGDVLVFHQVIVVGQVIKQVHG
jgi:hypothetical protein